MKNLNQLQNNTTDYAPTKSSDYSPIENITLYSFLQAFYGDNPEAIIHLRKLPPKDENGDAVKGNGFYPKNLNPYKLEKFAEESFREFLEVLIQPETTPHGLFFHPNGGGRTNTEISDFNAVFVEFDDLPIEEQHCQLDASPLPTSIRVETGKSVHAYWLLEKGTTREQWLEITQRLITYFNSDKSVSNEARLMRLPFFDHIKIINGEVIRKPVQMVQFNPERRYSY